MSSDFELDDNRHPILTLLEIESSTIQFRRSNHLSLIWLRDYFREDKKSQKCKKYLDLINAKNVKQVLNNHSSQKLIIIFLTMTGWGPEWVGWWRGNLKGWPLFFILICENYEDTSCKISWVKSTPGYPYIWAVTCLYFSLWLTFCLSSY